MTDKPTLEAILKLDAAQFKTNIDGARAKANSFSAKMGDMKQGVNGVSKAMGGLNSIAGTTSGALGGIARTISGVMSAFSADPIFAVVTALAALAAAVGKFVEGRATQLLEATKKQIAAYKEQKAAMIEASPERFGKTEIGRAEYEAKNETTAEIAARAKAEREKMARQEEMLNATDSSGKKFGGGAQDPVRIEYERSKARLKIYEDELAERAKKGRDAVEKDIENDQYREEQRAKLREDGRKSVSEDMEKGWKEFETAEKKKAGLKSDLESGLRDIRAGKGLHLSSPVADSMAKMGGYIGAQADPGARARERQSQMAAEVRNLVAEIRDKLNEVVE